MARSSDFVASAPLPSVVRGFSYVAPEHFLFYDYSVLSLCRWLSIMTVNTVASAV